MGAMTPASALMASGLIGSGSSLASGLLSSSSAAKNNRSAFDFQRWSQLQAQQWQEQMYSQQKMDQENFYKKYQSPEAIAAQLSKLGVNPAQVLSGGSCVGATPASIPSGMSSPALSAPSLENEGTALASSIQAVGNAMSSLASAGRQSEQSEELLHTFSSRMTQLLLQNGNTRLANAKARWDLFAEQVKLPFELQNMVLDAYSDFAQGKYTESLTRLNGIKEYIEDKTKDIQVDERQKALDLIIQQIAVATEQKNLIKAQTITEGEKAKTEKSAQAANYASANESRQRAETEKVLRPYRKTIERANAYIAQASSPSQIKEAENKAKREVGFVKLLKQQEIQAALQNKDMAAYNALWRIIHGRDKAGDVKMVYNALQNYVEFESK